MSFTKRYPLGLKELLNNIRITLQNSLLPSGAIVWFNLPNPPSGWVVCDGTNETPNLIGRYPLGATSSIGSTVEAGLPNIEGRYSDWVSNVRADGLAGAFYKAEYGQQNEHCKHENGYVSAGDVQQYALFSASRSNPIYGNSNTVTPPSVKLLPCMKL